MSRAVVASVLGQRTQAAVRPDGEWPDPAQLAAEALDLVGSDPLAAIDCAQRALAATRTRPDPAARTVAWRAIGLAARDRGDLEGAEAALRRAVRAASQAGDRSSAAEARMTLSFVLLDAGRTTQALRQSARAADDLDGVPHLRLQAQRALIQQRCGRFGAALATYDAVVPQLHRAEDRVWESRVLSNRGVLRAYLGDLDGAERDLNRARDLRVELGRHLEAARTLWNLGCLARERGDVVLALERFDAAEPVLAALGAPSGQHHLDRSLLLLSVGVVSEARELAESARTAFAATGHGADLVESEVLLARIALLERDADAAVESARAARTEAARQQRTGWVLLARHLELLGLEQSGAGDPGLLAQAVDLAEELGEEHWSEAAFDARLTAVRIATAQGQPARAAELLAPLARTAQRGPVLLRLRHHHTVALLRLAQGDDRAAAAAVRAGLAVLARHRAGLGASDLQAHLPVLGEDLARLGLGIALRSGSARRVLREVERWRGQDLRSRPVRPPRDPELQDAVDRLRRATSELRDVAGGQAPDDAQLGVVAQRERDVVRLSRRTRATGWRQAPRPADVEELRAGLGGAVLVEYLAVDGELVALTLAGADVPGRRGPRWHRLGAVDALREPLLHLRFALGRLATGRGSNAALAAALVGARQGADALQTRLLEPLSDAIRCAEALVIAPTEALHAVPWSMLPSAARTPLHLVRSGTAWLGAVTHRQGARDSRERPADVFVTGPDVTLAPLDLSGGRDDAGAGAVALEGPSATVAATTALLDGAAVAHVAAHGTFRADNPMLSSLQLADGPLTVYDLEALERAPQLVVLAACHSATAQVLPGNQLLGVAHALLTLGASGVVATTLPTPDAETAVVMAALHAGLRRGLDAGPALHQARSQLDLDTPAGLATSAGFDLYGC